MRTLCIFVLCLMVPMSLSTHYNNMAMYAQPMTSTALIQSARPRPTYQYAKRRYTQNLPSIVFLKHLMELDCLKEIFNEGRQKNLDGFLTNEFKGRTNAGSHYQMSRVVAPEELRSNGYPNHQATQRPRRPAQPEAEVAEGKKFSGNKRLFENPGGTEDFNGTQSEEESKLSKGYHSEGGENANEKADAKDDEISHGEDYVMEGLRDYLQAEETGEAEEKSNEGPTTKSGNKDDYFFPMMVSFGDDKQFSKFSQQPGGKASTSPHPETVSFHHLWRSKKPILIRPYEVEEIMEEKVNVDVNKEKLDSGKGLEFRGRKIFEIGNKKNLEEKVKITFSVKGEKKEEKKVPEGMIDSSINKILRGLINPTDETQGENEEVKVTTEKRFTLAKNASSFKNEALWGRSDETDLSHLPRKFLSYNFSKEKTRKDDSPKGNQGVFNRNQQPPDASVRQLTTKMVSGYRNRNLSTTSNYSKGTSKPTTETQTKQNTSFTPTPFLKITPKFHVLQDPKQKFASNISGPKEQRRNTTFDFLGPRQKSAYNISGPKEPRRNTTFDFFGPRQKPASSLPKSVPPYNKSLTAYQKPAPNNTKDPGSKTTSKFQVLEDSRRKPTYNFPVQEDPRQKLIFNGSRNPKQKATTKSYLTEIPRPNISSNLSENPIQNTTSKFQMTEGPRQMTSRGDPRKKTTSNILRWESTTQKTTSRFQVLEISRQTAATSKFRTTEGPRQKFKSNIFGPKAPTQKTTPTSPVSEDTRQTVTSKFEESKNPRPETNFYLTEGPRQQSTATPSGVLVDHLDLNFSNLLKHFVNQQNEGKQEESSVPLVIQRTTTSEPRISSSPPSLPNSIISTRAVVKDELVLTSATKNLLTSRPPSPPERSTTTLKNDSTTPQHSTSKTPIDDRLTFVVSAAAASSNTSEKMILPEVAWKNSRKMHFEQESQKNKTSEVPEHRRSDILITDNLEEDDNRDTAMSFVERLRKNGTRLSSANLTSPSIVPYIPVVINDLRDNKISSEDNGVLSEYFGKYWPYILSLSNNTHLDMLPLIKMKDEKDLENVLRSFVLESSEANSTTTVAPASVDNSETYDGEDYGNGYDYTDDYRDMYREILGQELDFDEKKRLRGKRDEEEAVKRSEAMREYFESIEEERGDEGNDYIFEDIKYDTTLDDIDDLNLFNLANLQVNITSWGS